MKLVDTVKHTAPPWTVTHQCLTDQSWDIIAETVSGGQCVATCGRCESAESNTAANAHFICLAVNSHAALVNAIQLALHRLDHRGTLADVGVDRQQYETALALAQGTKEVHQ